MHTEHVETFSAKPARLLITGSPGVHAKQQLLRASSCPRLCQHLMLSILVIFAKLRGGK